MACMAPCVMVTWTGASTQAYAWRAAAAPSMQGPLVCMRLDLSPWPLCVTVYMAYAGPTLFGTHGLLWYSISTRTRTLCSL